MIRTNAVAPSAEDTSFQVGSVGSYIFSSGFKYEKGLEIWEVIELIGKMPADVKNVGIAGSPESTIGELDEANIIDEAGKNWCNQLFLVSSYEGGVISAIYKSERGFMLCTKKIEISDALS